MTLNYRFDAKGLVNAVCGIPNAEGESQRARVRSFISQLHNHGLKTVERKGIEKWFDRGIIPGDHLLDIHILSVLQGNPIVIYPYLTDMEGNNLKVNRMSITKPNNLRGMTNEPATNGINS